MGCIVDAIRYPHRTTMRFYKDSEVETPVCWYFAAPEAKPLGFYTRFGSGLWGKDYMDQWEGVGQTPFASIDFRSHCCALPGKAPRGTPEQFAEGIDLDEQTHIAGLIGDCSRVPPTYLPMVVDVIAVGSFAALDQTIYDESDGCYEFSIGYVPRFARLTIAGSPGGTADGSWRIAWPGLPLAGVIWTLAAQYLDTGDPPIPDGLTCTIFCDKNNSDNWYATLTIPGYGSLNLLNLYGTYRPANLSGDGSATPGFSGMTVSVAELAPLVPAPYRFYTF